MDKLTKFYESIIKDERDNLKMICDVSLNTKGFLINLLSYIFILFVGIYSYNNDLILLYNAAFLFYIVIFFLQTKENNKIEENKEKFQKADKQYKELLKIKGEL